jgi:hypothetical protein
MVITMVAMWMVQVVVHPVIIVRSMRDLQVPTGIMMEMALIVILAVTLVVRRAPLGVPFIHRDKMLFDFFLAMMKVPMMQVVHMVLMQDRRMIALRAMRVRMLTMEQTTGHHTTLRPSAP